MCYHLILSNVLIVVHDKLGLFLLSHAREFAHAGSDSESLNPDLCIWLMAQRHTRLEPDMNSLRLCFYGKWLDDAALPVVS